MLKKIKDYFKNTDKRQKYMDFYAVTFSAAGLISMIYLAYIIVGWVKK